MRISNLLPPGQLNASRPLTNTQNTPSGKRTRQTAISQDQLCLNACLNRPKTLPLNPLKLFDALPNVTSISLINSSESLEKAYLIEQAKIQQVGPLLEQLPNFSITPLRIALEENVTTAQFHIVDADLYLKSPEGTHPLGEHMSGHFEVQAQENGFSLYHNEQKVGDFTGQLEIQNHSDQMQINGLAYRGNLNLMPHPTQNNTLQVINEVLLEDYLKSVVPSESPASWPQESLKAQALAARTYAVANWGKHTQNGFDLKDDTSDQMYKGIASEHPNTNAAVAATAQQIMVYNQRPITALFFSTSGGYTDSAKEVWGMDLPYIQPKPDFDQASPRYRWSVERSSQDLMLAAENLGLDLGNILNIIPLTHTPQGRVKTLKLVGTKGTAELDANKFRFAARLYSTLWQVESTGSEQTHSFTFNGGGWGHGLGMSQWGARQMAKDGHDAESIVKHYFQDIELSTLPTETTP